MNGDLHPRADGPAEADWEDRLVDLALQELHGDRPPDLAAAVQRRIEAGERPRRVALPPRAGAPRRLPWLLPLLAAAVLLVLLPWLAGERRLDRVQLDVAVARGELTVLAPPAAPLALRAGGARPVVLRRGDRLRTAARATTEMTFGPFGTVLGEPHSELEVVDMQVTMTNGWVAAGSLTLAVVAGAASWHFITGGARAEAGDVLRLETPSVEAMTTELASMRAANAKLREEKEQLEQRMRQLEEQRERQALAAAAEPKVEEPPPPVEDGEPAAAAAAAPLFDDPRFEAALREVDWDLMGRVAGEMAGPLLEFAKRLEEGGELPIDLAIEIQKLNMQLIEELPVLMKAELPGTGPNGVFTHPLVVGNQLASLLEHGGLPLDDAQRAAIGAIVRRYAAENDGIRASESEVGLDGVLAEIAMKDRMYDEIAAQLGPQQAAMVYPEGAGRYDGTSLFRTGLLWSTLVAPVNVATPAAYATSAGQQVQQTLQLDAAATEQVRRIMSEVAAGAPAELWTPGAAIETSQARFLRSGRARRAAEVQQQWMHRVLREVPLSAEQRRQLREMRRVIVPVPR